MGKTVIKGNAANTFTRRCPWCERWPEIQTHDHTRFWGICVTPGCPTNPITEATDTAAAAAALWNLCRR